MAVIVMASSKGGAGKSTLALVLALALESAGASVTLIDADPNRPLVRWRGGPSKSTIDVVGDITEGSIIRNIVDHANRAQFVIVDCEGTANRLVSRAIAKASLVLIPLQASALDSNEAGKAVALIHEEEEALGRGIPFRMILTRTSPLIISRIEGDIYESLNSEEIPMLKTRLHERQAYKALFVRRLSLDELIDDKDPDKEMKKLHPELVVSRLNSAKENAALLADEITELLDNLEPPSIASVAAVSSKVALLGENDGIA